MKRVAISQSNYIPWKGYFDNIAQVDEFVLYDDMQYTRRDWRNRNKIKTRDGLKWLTVPVNVKGKYFQKIKDTRISDKKWSVKHLNILKQSYSKASNFKEVFPLVEYWYNEVEKIEIISEVNYYFLDKICKYLNIQTKLSFSNDYIIKDNMDKTERLVDICMQMEATDYYTGLTAKSYIDSTKFIKEGINVHYYDYSGYKEYNQLFEGFKHEVSILDLIFNEGSKAANFLKFRDL